MYYGWLEEFICKLTPKQRRTLGFPNIETLPSKVQEGVLARYPLLSKL